MICKITLLMLLSFSQLIASEKFLETSEEDSNNIDYIIKRNGAHQHQERPSRAQPSQEFDSKERRGMGSSFIRFGRGSPKGSDIIIRYGRDGVNNYNRISRLRQERLRKLYKLSYVCATANDNPDLVQSSAEERFLRDICRDAPLHPTLPDYI